MEYMSSLKKSGISLLGWTAFVLLNNLFNIPLTKWVLQIQADSQWDDFTVIAILFPASLVLGFLAFAISFHGVIFPILRRSNLTASKPKNLLIFEWVVYYIVFTVLCWPIPLIQGLLSYTSIPIAVLRAIKPVGQTLVSFIIYRENVSYHVKEFQDQLENTKIQAQELV
jgi:hypothetical protein